MNRLRTLAERPVDAGVARAIVVLALAVTVGLACVVGLSGRGGAAGPGTPTGRVPRVAARAPVRPATPHRRVAAGPRHRHQDPQDRPGTAAHRRAARELATHRALQHVPWRGAGVTISLVGARDGRAVLAVRGPGLAADRRAWRSFLRRYRDEGGAYLPRLRSTGGRRGR